MVRLNSTLEACGHRVFPFRVDFLALPKLSLHEIRLMTSLRDIGQSCEADNSDAFGRERLGSSLSVKKFGRTLRELNITSLLA